MVYIREEKRMWQTDKKKSELILPDTPSKMMEELSLFIKLLQREDVKIANLDREVKIQLRSLQI